MDLSGCPAIAEQALLDFYHLIDVADKLEPKLAKLVRDCISTPFGELYAKLVEAMVKYRDPASFEDVCQMGPGLRGQALIYLLDRYLSKRTPSNLPGWKVDRWRDWLYDWNENGDAEQVIADRDVCTPEHLIDWFLSHEQQLFSDFPGPKT